MARTKLLHKWRTAREQASETSSSVVETSWPRWILAAATLAACLCVSGCAHWIKENANINGAQQLAVNDAAVRRVDLPGLIVAASPNAGPASLKADFSNRCGEPNAEKYDSAEGSYPDVHRKCIELATEIFNSDGTAQMLRRNDIQARLMAASEAECSQFVQHLNSLQGFGNLVTGSAATILSGAGAIVTHVNAARAFGGLGAIVSGVRAEFNSDLFLQQAGPTISKAIAQERTKMRSAIVATRSKSVADYPLWAAIGDAFQFNDQCSLVKGLAAMDRALDLAENPGPEALEKEIVRFGRIRTLAANPGATLAAAPGAAGTSTGTSTSATGTAAGDPQARSSTGAADVVTIAYQQTLDALYQGEQGLLAVSGQGVADPGLGKCTDAEQSAITQVGVRADCMRREAEAKLKECIGDRLPTLSAQAAMVKALGQTQEGAATPASSVTRDGLARSAKAQASWLSTFNDYVAASFDSARKYMESSRTAAARADSLADETAAAEKAAAIKLRDSNSKFADDTLRQGTAGISKMACFQNP